MEIVAHHRVGDRRFPIIDQILFGHIGDIVGFRVLGQQVIAG